MASTRFPSLSFRDFVLAYVFSLSLLFSLERNFAIKGRKLGETHQIDYQHFHTIELGSLLPSDSCKSTCTEVPEKSSTTLKLVHRYSPRIQLQKQNQGVAKAPSYSDVLRSDQLRVNSIHAKQRSSNLTLLNDMKTTVPTSSGTAVGSSNYVVRVGLGTPQKKLTLAFDTGSDITWTQCQPCLGSCYPQSDPIFDPAKSTSYKNISCSSSSCSLIGDSGGRYGCYSNSTCIYLVGYADNSFSSGFFVTETLTLSSSHAFKNFIFGCGQQNAGLFGQTAGIIGLGPGQLSFPSQTAKKYKKLFSYCIPKSRSCTGYLNLGGPVPSATKFTPLSTLPQTRGFYGVDITGITVNGKTLPIEKSVFTAAGGVVDSGTVFSWLPPKAYSALRSKFRELMKGYPRVEGASADLDTCYDLSGNDTLYVPSVGVVFRGGVAVKVDASGTLVPLGGLDKVCLAFAKNTEDGDLAIFGNEQQKGYEVVYDGRAKRVGFAPARC